MILPIQFASLENLAERWCVDDDVDRDQPMAAATDDEPRLLAERVTPFLEEINSYLDDHQDEAACDLGTLAEAACKAQLDLDRRS